MMTADVKLLKCAPFRLGTSGGDAVSFKAADIAKYSEQLLAFHLVVNDGHWFLVVNHVHEDSSTAIVYDSLSGGGSIKDPAKDLPPEFIVHLLDSQPERDMKDIEYLMGKCRRQPDSYSCGWRTALTVLHIVHMVRSNVPVLAVR